MSSSRPPSGPRPEAASGPGAAGVSAGIRVVEQLPSAEPMERTSALSSARAVAALRSSHNWVQLAKFCAVGGVGYVVNLAVYTALLEWAGLHYIPSATVSFVVAASNNYTLNRLWTFRGQRGHVVYQGMRFFTVATAAYLANIGVLSALIALGAGKIVGQAAAIVLVTPLNFVGNKLWSFRLRP